MAVPTGVTSRALDAVLQFREGNLPQGYLDQQKGEEIWDVRDAAKTLEVKLLLKMCDHHLEEKVLSLL